MQSINLLASLHQAHVEDAKVSFKLLSVPFVLDFETEDVIHPQEEALSFKNQLKHYTAERHEIKQILLNVETVNELVVLDILEKSFLADFETIVDNYIMEPRILAEIFAVALRCIVQSTKI